MDADLTAIVAADEEARARVHAARAAAADQVEQVRDQIETDRARRLEALRADAAREVQAIDQQTAQTIRQREAARARSIEARRQSTAARLEAAAEIYTRIVIDGPTVRESA